MTTDSAKACYVYGIVPGDAAAPDLPGVGEPSAPVTVVRHGRAAALVSDVPTGRPLGTARDLRTHAGVLDAVAGRGTAVLPFRFGAVLADPRAVEEELLAPAEAEFDAALHRLAGWVQYTVRGGYRQDRVLRDVLTSHPEIDRLRAEVRDRGDGEADRRRRIRLGELIARALADRRAEDSRTAVERLGPLAGALVESPVSGAEDTVDASFLVRREEGAAFQRAAEALARDWADTVELRLLGPLAPYDFVSDPAGPAAA